MELWEILKARRKNNKISQALLAELIGGNSDTIMNIETGRSIPRPGTVWRVGAALCLSRSEIQNCLELVEYHKKHRLEYKMNYTIRMAKKCLSEA